MGYEVHIIREGQGAISLAEWRDYVAGDPEMQADDFLNPTFRAGKPTAWELIGASVWVPYSKNGRHGRYARFYHQYDRVTVPDPDEEILGKMLLVAHALRARVQGADGEYFDEDNAAPAGMPTGPTWADREYRVFQTFASAEAAKPLLAALARQGMVPLGSSDTGQVAFDPSFANNQLTSKFTVKLPLADFERGSQVLADLNEDAVNQANPNHYLFKASDEELFELLVKPDEWSSFDVALASQLLRRRGRDITPDTLRLLRQHRLTELTQPEPAQDFWIGGGYVSAMFGGVIGLFIGYHLYTHRKQLPDGRRVYAYSDRDRTHGVRIFVLSIVMLTLYTGLTILQYAATE